MYSMCNMYFNLFLLVNICVIDLKYVGSYDDKDAPWRPSLIRQLSGHYPPVFCEISNVIFSPSEQAFMYSGTSEEYFQTKCPMIGTIWPFIRQSSEKIQAKSSCQTVYRKAYIFTIYYFYGSNYFHLHYDMLLPLFSLLYDKDRDDNISNLSKNSNTLSMHKIPDGEESIALMPTVETSRLQKLDWKTVAFEDESKIWIDMLKFLAGSYDLIPLSDRLLKSNTTTICIDKAYFGTPSVNFASEGFIQRFVSFVRTSFGISHILTASTNSGRPRIGIISRKSRRQILNEQELVEATEDLGDVQLVEFSGLSFSEQVHKVQHFTVLIGMNGAGLTNAIYLPPTSVAVQLVPYKAVVNFDSFAEMLRARGPYLEWHNEHEDLTVLGIGDIYNNHADTYVHKGEFRTLVIEAIASAETARLEMNGKTEL